MLRHLGKYSLRTQCLAIGVASAIIASTSGVIGSLASWFIGDEMHQFETAASEALLASEINADVAKTLLNGREYLVTRGEADLKQTRRYVGEVKEGIAQAQEVSIPPNSPPWRRRWPDPSASWKKGSIASSP